MNPIWGHMVGAFIVVLMIAFIGIWAWAWLPRHKPAFNELARLPMEDDGTIATEAEVDR
ncbi:MAG TPA: cbb3-type cytochrome c oxidase subunit 3 [Burkholderiaceae bacterium]|nr:cbb3-type cytochrome c oxidase subunit 3 [Burkholderiaceae bacterium]